MVQYRLNIETESRIRWKVYVRFGGEYWETYHRNMTRRWVLSLRVHHRGNGEGGGVPSGGAAGRRHRSRHPAACRKAEKQAISNQ